tara:strand:+ start:21 stop:785 length:765 start_codon:yes stop_codon:yes gene_type:complete
MCFRCFGSALLSLWLLATSGCTALVTPNHLPPVGEPQAHAYILEESAEGPIVVLFPGRSAPTNDPNLGILRTAEVLADRITGSIAVFNVHAYDAAHEWLQRQSELRRESGAPRRLALVGHSWGAGAAGRLLEQGFAEDLIDEVTTLVTIDGIEEGYLWVFFGHMPSVFSLEILFPHRLCVLSLTEAPTPDGQRFREHINYYQIDSPHLSGYIIPTATQNHEVWFDCGSELGHGNLDNYICYLVVEDVLRAQEAK